MRREREGEEGRRSERKIREQKDSGQAACPLNCSWLPVALETLPDLSHHLRFKCVTSGFKRSLPPAFFPPPPSQPFSKRNRSWLRSHWPLSAGHESYVTFCQLEDEAAFTCSADCTIRKWDVLTGQCLQVFRGHTSIVNRSV